MPSVGLADPEDRTEYSEGRTVRVAEVGEGAGVTSEGDRTSGGGGSRSLLHDLQSWPLVSRTGKDCFQPPCLSLRLGRWYGLHISPLIPLVSNSLLWLVNCYMIISVEESTTRILRRRRQRGTRRGFLWRENYPGLGN